MSPVIKKLLVDAVLCVALFLVSTGVAHLAMMLRPGCVLCAGWAGMAFWLPAVGAVQPVLWLGEGAVRMRVLVWAVALVAGSGTMALMLWLASGLEGFGLPGAAEEVVNVTRLVCFAVPVLIGSALMSRRSEARAGASPMRH